MSNIIQNTGEIVLYQPDESVKLEVKLENETVWLTQTQMAELFSTTRNNVTLHIRNVFKEGELDEFSVCKESLLTAADGKNYRTKYYNLDVIISVGYRVKSQRGTQFRQWANKVLKDYLLRGYSVNLHLVALQQQMDNRFNALERRVDTQQEKVDFLVNMHQQPQEELFATGCMWDAYSFITNIIRSAKEKVELVDNYCNDRTLTMLDERAEGVIAIVHTTYNKNFEDALGVHNSQKAQIKYIQLPHKVHDRFLIIDTRVYLLGNSLKDMGHTLSAAILTGFNPEEVLLKLI